MDSNKSGIEESNSALEEGTGGGVSRDALGNPLPKHLGHETGCLMAGLIPCGPGPGVLP